VRPWLLIHGLLSVCLGLPSLAVAQEAPLLPTGPTTPAPWETAWPRGLPAETPPPPAPIELSLPIERNPFLDVDVLLGVPTAARVGLAVFRYKEQALLVEAMAGLDYFIIPFVAAGARYRFVAWHTERFELVIKPGADAYAGVAPFVIGALPVFGIGGDVACVFLHNGPHHGAEWGVDLGAIGLGGASIGAVPLASFILGFNF
jgi:hypothetical protein